MAGGGAVCRVRGLGVQLGSLKIYLNIYCFSLWAMRPAAPDSKITKIDLRFISINTPGTPEALEGTRQGLKCGSAAQGRPTLPEKFPMNTKAPARGGFFQKDFGQQICTEINSMS